MTSKEYQREYYQRNKERLNAKSKKYAIDNKEALTVTRKAWALLNKEKIQQKNKEEYQSLTPKERKDRDLRCKYGITLAQYDKMLKEQNNSCACCGITVDTLLTKYPKSFHGSLVVDHDHETGKVRELLCSKCNTLVGYLEKRKELIPKAYEYINKHK